MADQIHDDWNIHGWADDDWASIQFLTVELADVSAELSKGVQSGSSYTPQDLCALSKLAGTISNRLLDVSSRYT